MTQPAPTTQHALVEEAEAGAATKPSGKSDGESTGTVIVAGLANLAIAVAKLFGGLISHSSAMMSEAAHSLADTVTEVLLFIALKRGNRAPDARHPFGYGRETYFWAFLAALCTFGVGAGFSVWQGVTTIIEREPEGSPTISYVILAVSFVLESSSLLKAVRQVRGAAAERNISARQYLRHTTDTTVKAVTFEDSAALVGLVLAALGLFLEQITGDPLWDGVAADRAGAEGRDREHAARGRRPAAAHVGDRAGEDPGGRQGGLRRHVHRGRRRARRRRGGEAPRPAARGRALRLPRPHEGGRPCARRGAPARR